MRPLIKGMGSLVRPAFSASAANAKSLSSVVPDLIPMLSMKDFKMNQDDVISQKTFGTDVVDISSHRVVTGHDAKGVKYAFKHINESLVGDFSPEESKKQAVMEVAAAKMGAIFCKGQFPDSNVAADDEGNYYVVSKFLENAISVRDLRTDNHMVVEDRSESPFYVPTDSPGSRTRVHVDGEVLEHLMLPDHLKNKMKREGYTVTDPEVRDRVKVKLGLFTLGDKDKEFDNRDGNTLIVVTEYKMDQDNKLITPIVKPVAIDLGLCFGERMQEEDLFRKAVRLASRTDDSTTMGLELNGLPPVNLKKIKDEYLVNMIKIEKSGQIDKIIESASNHLGDQEMQDIAHVKKRMELCCLAGELVKAGLDIPEELATQEQKDRATDLMTEKLSQMRSNTNRVIEQNSNSR